ncbi:MAG: tRNA (guanosine(46)-N7)-methyltransferase TrmB [Gemmatimonadetes bacterium]|nr:MAG: tRNA (guanosine(46)-N7)-methyltransferase TrmB [Gemmatimonadota bacterium]
MAKRKRQHLAELETFDNVYQQPVLWKGQWATECFGNSHPITLELACGKGEYTVELARRFPQTNFIGVDIKGARIWRGAKTAIETGIPNVAFIRTYIQFLPEYFGKDEISEIWITFPDPYIKPSKWRKRLTSSFFLNIYRQILKPEGHIHLKTDSDKLYQFTLETLQAEKCTVQAQIDDIYGQDCPNELLSIQTYYEKKHLANQRTIKYVCFTL